MNLVFANCSKENAVYPLTISEIAESQSADITMGQPKTKPGYSIQLVKSTMILCKDDNFVIAKDLQDRVVAWYHHYLQHPGSTRLEETLRSAMYWKVMRHTIQSHVKRCHSSQVNKLCMQKYGKLPAKLVVTNPWEVLCEVLCVDLIGPYTLKGKEGTHIDFMCVTMIDPATSWFEIVELSVSEPSLPDIPNGTKGCKGTNAHKHERQPYFDKTSATVGMLVNRTWLCRYPCSQYIVYDNRSELQLHFKSLCDT